jgi:hypothetical protein
MVATTDAPPAEDKVPDRAGRRSAVQPLHNLDSLIDTERRYHRRHRSAEHIDRRTDRVDRRSRGTTMCVQE